MFSKGKKDLLAKPEKGENTPKSSRKVVAFSKWLTQVQGGRMWEQSAHLAPARTPAEGGRALPPFFSPPLTIPRPE